LGWGISQREKGPGLLQLFTTTWGSYSLDGDQKLGISLRFLRLSALHDHGILQLGLSFPPQSSELQQSCC
jgi:hypothetical protein